ncbi:hypothetical protein F5984_14430 [Rudanella paleaurantiibacter]|uniref:Ricin B lectin domain-containing protein n=1 Tax=Rudanella paleaurantiibacter TaxID=2614655 RepID=A0A7J5U176_9BACT|nr:RICIN domain-containing protein [Rudanella paleaurantiibacter]KAB7730350.1 hypothetical protein F5984_14430 [Rudanella paleaurantiibacter]
MKNIAYSLMLVTLFSTVAMAQFDPNYKGYYRLKTVFQGQEVCLEGNQASAKTKKGLAFMDKKANSQGQFWTIEASDKSGYYILKNLFRGAGECLDITNANDASRPGLLAAQMRKAEKRTGQYWMIEPVGNDTYRLKTLYTGNNKCLEGNAAWTGAKDGITFMDDCKNVTGQLWKFERIK